MAPLHETPESKKPHGSVARAAILALLLPACATVADTTQGKAPDADSKITEPIHCLRTFSTLRDIPLDQKPCNGAFPDTLEQRVEFTETIRSRISRGRSTYQIETSLKPAPEPKGDCRTVDIDRWITPTQEQDPNPWNNEDLIGLALLLQGGTTQVSSDVISVLANREVAYFAQSQSVVHSLLKGYRIQRTPKGVHFQAKMMKCDR